MSARLSRGDRVLLLSGTAVFVILIALTAILSRGGVSQLDAPTTYSARSKGLKGAFLLLQASGYRTARWERPPAELPDPARTTLILAEPLGSPTRADRTALQAFIARGGRVIATGASGAPFVSGTAEPELTGLPVAVPAASPSPITRAAPLITIAPSAYWIPAGFSLPLYGNEEGSLVVESPLGRGEAIWWANATPFNNAGLRAPGNLNFFLACLGPAADRQVLWDEYFHGYRYSLAQSMWHSQVRWLFAQAALLAFAIFATHSRRSGPIVAPLTPSRLSPLEFVRTLGSLYQRAGATTVAVDIAAERLRSWLSRRLGVRDTKAVDQLAEAAGRRPGVDGAALAMTLRACEAAHGAPMLRPKDALALVQAISAHAASLQVYSQSPIMTKTKSRIYMKDEA